MSVHVRALYTDTVLAAFNVRVSLNITAASSNNKTVQLLIIIITDIIH